MVWPLSLFSGDNSKPVVESESECPPPSSSSSDVTASSSSSSSPIDLLRHFESPDVPLPPSARIGDPKLKQRESQPLRPWQLWKFGAFAAAKATGIVSDVVSHQIWGPRRKSWGIEMTLLSSIMRDVGRHSHLADVVTIRMLMSIGGYAPLPSDALVTPVTFHVHKRKLRGILADFDAGEDGSRELSAEWVVGKKTWQRLQREWKASRKSADKHREQDNTPSPSMNQPRTKERVVLYIHGGAYYCFSAATHRLITIPLSKYLDARVFSLDYRLAPETRFPGPLHDAVSAYLRLTKDLRIPPENIMVAGDSAGGGLCLALLMYLRDNEYPLPSGAILFSPWVDLTMSCDSWDSNAQYDIVPAPQPGDHLNPIACYLGEDMEKYLTHPYASPLFGDLKGLPPILIQAGECEVLRDEITLLAHKATLAGVEVRHELYEDAVHVFQSLPFLDIAQHAFMSCRDFVRDFLPQHQSRSPQTLEAAEVDLAQEINNDDARVVCGDGTESGSALAEIGKATDSVAQKRRRPAASEEEDTSHPSWGAMPAPPASEDEVDHESDIAGQRMPAAPPQRKEEKAHPPERPAYARFQSALSVIADVSYRTARGQVHRSPSYQHLQAPKRRARMSSLSMSPNLPVPQPAIRRSDISHPDITVLCREWADLGPANSTTTVRLDKAPQRARSRTDSSASVKDL